MAEIPVIFCFDDRILLGAGVSILSLLDAAAPTTVYDIHILHPGLSARDREGLSSLTRGTRHELSFHPVSADRFAGLVKGRGSWTEIVYFRLLAPEILPDLDKAIYSDVDVFFKQDLGDVFATNLGGAGWAGVAAEANRPDAVLHRHFPENPKELIFFSGFMVMNLDQMRRDGAVNRYIETIRTFGERLKFFDLDVLNIATDRIARLPFAYVTLEDVFEAEDVTKSQDYAYLRTVYSVGDLEAAREDPAIIHYAGRRGKPWQRQSMPDYYRAVVRRLPRGLRRSTFRDWRKKWLSARGWRTYPVRGT
ncbi:MAG: glycosyltransferase family 8 protein [Marinibacterium sp.]